MDDAGREDSELEDLAELDAGPSTSRLHLPSSSRQMRNEAEKKRRDTLNGYITELGKLVPMVDGTPRRVDKISILRLAATYLMQNQILHTGEPRTTSFLPVALESYNLSQNMIEDMDAFLMVVTAAGKIVFVSHTVEKLLGHTQIDMFGQSLFNFTLKEDHTALTRNLTADRCEWASPEDGSPEDARAADDSTSSSDSSEAADALVAVSPPAPVAPDDDDERPELQRRSFHVALSQRSASRAETPEFKRVHFLGNLRVPRGRAARRHRGEWGTGAVLVALVRLDRRIRELSLLEASRDEYVTRHLIDGRIIYSDHRISLVAGYLSEEVSGMSAFKFMHPEDVMFTIVALRQMYDRGEGYGSSCYRLQCATGQFIYLRTHGYLERSDASNQVESFICINTLVCTEDGERLIADMKARYSASIEAAAAAAAAAASEPSAVTELQIDRAISALIPAAVETPTESPLPDAQYWKAALTSRSLPPAAVHRASVITRRRRHESLSEQSSETTPKRHRQEPLTPTTPEGLPLDSGLMSPDYLPPFPPGFREPDFREPDFREPGFGEPGFREPDFREPGFGEPGFGEPGFGRLGFGKPGLGGQPGSPAEPVGPGFMLPQRAFSRLRSDLQVQNVVITAIQHDMEQVPAEKSRPPLLESLAQIKKEHKEHQAMLNGLAHKLHETLGEGNAPL